MNNALQVQQEEEEEMAGKVMAMADGNALTPEADCQPLTHERKVRTDLETHLPKPCMLFFFWGLSFFSFFLDIVNRLLFCACVLALSSYSVSCILLFTCNLIKYLMNFL
ncbi:hypothetical protein HanOQP8_Chr11g0415981 [Helianthus annuus]|nr:hypothetical protein HanOQP8_Chr11g0415981 [Helianthus annuus]